MGFAPGGNYDLGLTAGVPQLQAAAQHDPTPADSGPHIPAAKTMFLALPISWRGTLQQYAGRLHRAHAGKRVVQIYDYVDEQVPVLGRMYRKRLRGYRAMGYAVTDTGAEESKGAGAHHA